MHLAIRPTIVTPPSEEAVSLAEAKAHLRVDHTQEDDFIRALTAAAREYVENATGRRLVTTTLRLQMPSIGSAVELSGSPLASVTSVKYLDASLVEQTASTALYTVATNTEPGRIELADGQSWPTTGISPTAWRITYVAGYGAATAVPQTAKAAVKLLLGHWFENREAVITGTIATQLPLAAQALIDQLRVWRA